MAVSYYVVDERDSIRVPKLNADHAKITSSYTLDLDGGDATGPSTPVIDVDGGGA